MRLFCFTDTHADMKALNATAKLVRGKKPDLILCAGDITVFEHGMKKMLKKINSMKSPVLLIHGNHESQEDMRKACFGMKNIAYIHQSVHVMGDVAVIGWGGGGFSQKDKSFERWANKQVKTLKGKKIVLLTHGPPYKTRLDFIYDDNVGNKSYTSFIKKHKPVLAVCGHLHENEGKSDKIGKTRIINPGDKGKIVVV